MIIIKSILKILVILTVFISGISLGYWLKDNNSNNKMQSVKINNPNYSIFSNIAFVDENKHDFINNHAQFSISPDGNIKSLDGKNAILLIQHDKEDWDWYNAAVIDDVEVIEKYKVNYGNHRKVGFPAESIFDK